MKQFERYPEPNLPPLTCQDTSAFRLLLQPKVQGRSIFTHITTRRGPKPECTCPFSWAHSAPSRLGCSTLELSEWEKGAMSQTPLSSLQHSSTRDVPTARRTPEDRMLCGQPAGMYTAAPLSRKTTCRNSQPESLMRENPLGWRCARSFRVAVLGAGAAVETVSTPSKSQGLVPSSF